MAVQAKTKKTNINLTPDDVILLNSKIGMKHLFADNNVNIEKALRMAKYETTLRTLQTELIKLQNWVIENGEKVVIVFEGRDAAGKGGAIRRITSHINPRHFRIVALPKPTDEEEGQWYFQRYINQLPNPGEIVFFDRSWYNRAIVEPVNGFCTQEDYKIFMGQINEFERMVVESKTHLLKLYFSITKDEQAARFKEIKSSPLKKWKITPVDEAAQELWDEYTVYKERMFDHTNTTLVPWNIIDANRKTEARIEALMYILENIPYEPQDKAPIEDYKPL